jgi:hypothetical protein
MKALIKRFEYSDKQTLGTLVIYDKGEIIYTCYTLELPDLDNASQISCIPKGDYKVVPRTSAKFKDHFHITNVPNREYILIHGGNYYTQIRGCVLVGKTLTDINNDGYKDVTSSKNTLNKILELAPNGFELEIL